MQPTASIIGTFLGYLYVVSFFKCMLYLLHGSHSRDRLLVSLLDNFFGITNLGFLLSSHSLTQSRGP